MTRQKLGYQLTAMRRKAGLTQLQVATTLGFSTSQFISNWERGVSYPSEACLPKLAKVYGQTRRQLVDLIFETRVEELRQWRDHALRGREP